MDELFGDYKPNSWKNSVIFRASTLEEVVEIITALPARPDVRYLARNEKTNEYECIMVTGHKPQALKLIQKIKGK